jgi:oxaloacetate decarboxylase alpha subunit
MDLERIERLVKLFGQSHARELHLECDGWRLSLRQAEAAPLAVSPRPETEESVPEEGNATSPAEALLSITALLVGIFRQGGVRLQPGDRVESGQPVGSIESMKILSPVQAPEGGEIAEVLVEDGQPVEYGHQLFLLRPEDGRESDGGGP